LAAGSDDYYGGIATPLVPEKFKGNVDRGDIQINDHCVIGSNSTVLPNVRLGTGSVLGAQSLLNSNSDDWSVFAGSPAKKIAERDKDKILSLQKSFEEDIDV
jgi:galactoside O-acetyltransferase